MEGVIGSLKLRSQKHFQGGHASINKVEMCVARRCALKI
jgi:hypothetical protein